jgi:hypothetical protein
MVEGGKRVKKRRSLGWRSWARRMWLCVAAILACVCEVVCCILSSLVFGDFEHWMLARESRSGWADASARSDCVSVAASSLKVYGESYTTTKQQHPNAPSHQLATSAPNRHKHLHHSRRLCNPPNRLYTRQLLRPSHLTSATS